MGVDSGGSSRREARSAGRTQRAWGGRRRPVTAGTRGPHMASAAALPKEPAEGALGKPESLHGAEFRHRPESARAGTSAGADGVPAFAGRGPQQQVEPRHVPHLQ